MVRYGTVGAVFLLLTTAALAQGADSTHNRHRHHAHSLHHVRIARPMSQQQGWNQWQAQPEEANVAPRYHQDGNSCGPDRPVPEWGDGNAFMGYSCEGESANGS